MRTRIGTEHPVAVLSSSVLRFVLVALLLGFAAWASPAQKVAPYAVVAGTVFREPGFAMAGVEVVLTFMEVPAGQKRLPKPMRAESDSRGEFAFHVPAGKAEYKVSAKAKGFTGEEKTASVQNDERIDVNLELRAVK
jgi:hypothetical protein